MNKHTPGPWLIEDHKNGCLFITGVDGDVCDLYFKRQEYGERQIIRFNNAGANAHLIAAAPELLEALEGMLIFCSENDEQWRAILAARAAITKAKGE